jgi:hypothetical protein
MFAGTRKKEGAMAGRDDHMMLMRIIAILSVIAALAESLVGAPAGVRRRVLLYLRPAEAIAREFLACETDGRGLRSLPFPAASDGDGPDDALRLALCLRALALALGAVLAQFGASHTHTHTPRHQSRRLALHSLAFVPVITPDTS